MAATFWKTKNPVGELEENSKLSKGENYLDGNEMKYQKNEDFIASGLNGVNVI